MIIKSRRGSAVIEFALSCVLYAMLIGLIGQMSFLTISYLWADHILYEALLCVETQKQSHPCLRQSRKKLERLTWTKTKPKLSLEKSNSHWKGSLLWTPYGFGLQKISQNTQNLNLKMGASL